MNTLSAIATPPLPPVAPDQTARAADPLLRAQETFAHTISRAQHRPGARSLEAEARASAEQLVSLALVEPALKSLRESSMAAPPFAATGAEKQFAAMLDSQRAADIVRSANMPLVDRLMRDLLSRATPAATPAASPAAAPTATPAQTTPAPAPAMPGPGALDTLSMDLIA